MKCELLPENGGVTHPLDAYGYSTKQSGLAPAGVAVFLIRATEQVPYRLLEPQDEYSFGNADTQNMLIQGG